MDRRLIDSLVQANLISRQDMQRVILRASSKKASLVAELAESGLIDESHLARAVAQFYGLELVPSQGFRADPMALGMVPSRTARRAGVIPYALNASRDRVFVALYDPEQAREVLEQLRAATGNEPNMRVASRRWIEEAIGHFYGRQQPGGVAPSGRAGRFEREGTPARPRGMGLLNTFDGPINLPTGGAAGGGDMVDQVLGDLDDLLDAERRGVGNAGTNPLDSLDLEYLNPDNAAPRSAPGSNSQSGPLMGNLSHFGSLGKTPDWERVPEQWSWEDFADGEGRTALPDSNTGNHPALKKPRSQAEDNIGLFEPSDLAPNTGTQVLVEVINRLEREMVDVQKELRRQREVIQVMADMLVESRLVDQGELRRRLRRIRKSRS